MSEAKTPVKKVTRSISDKKPRVRKSVIRTVSDETNDFKNWLKTVDPDITPTVHINGAAYTNCVLTVDFGTPLKGLKLTPEQSSDLVNRMRSLTKLIMDHDVKIGIMNDLNNGVWWTTIG